MTMTDQNNPVAVHEAAIVVERRAKLAQMRETTSPYPNDFSRTETALAIAMRYGEASTEELEKQQAAVTIAGRLMSKHVLGETSFGIVQDGFGRIQISLADDASGKSSHAAYAQWDTGDIVGLHGILYKTASDELTVRVHEIRLLVKALRPPTDLARDGDDEALACRPRYVELMVNAHADRKSVV